MLTPFRATLFIRAFGVRYIPLLAYCRPRVVDLSAARVEVKIPLTRRTKNHVGSMYIGVLATGADLAGGFLAIQAARDAKAKLSIVFKDLHAEFLKRADGDVHFVCEDGKAIVDAVARVAEGGERQTCPVSVIAVIPTSSAEPIARFQMLLSVKKTK
jgi:acyl-coenzyme A thioesterase PaaI-like protein